MIANRDEVTQFYRRERLRTALAATEHILGKPRVAYDIGNIGKAAPGSPAALAKGAFRPPRWFSKAVATPERGARRGMGTDRGG